VQSKIPGGSSFEGLAQKEGADMEANPVDVKPLSEELLGEDDVFACGYGNCADEEQPGTYCFCHRGHPFLERTVFE